MTGSVYSLTAFNTMAKMSYFWHCVCYCMQ